MPSITSKKFGWIKKPTLAQQFEGWRERRRKFRETDESIMSATNFGIADASIKQVTGGAELAAKASILRSQSALESMLDSANKLKIDKFA